MIKNLAEHQWLAAMELNLTNIFETLERLSPKTRVLDLGCDTGSRTMEYAKALGAKFVSGVELNEPHAAVARTLGVDVTEADLNKKLPLPDAEFDVVVSNQVIEHLADTDCFVRESFRVLVPGGSAVISTENLSSWHNIASLFFGWQPFSLTNVTSQIPGLGNPFALHRGDEDVPHDLWEHRRVFSYLGLKELFESHGFVDVRILGAGYYPLWAAVGRRDPRHAAFVTVVAVKPSA